MEPGVGCHEPVPSDAEGSEAGLWHRFRPRSIGRRSITPCHATRLATLG
jgi:hypothetical protein